MAMGPRTGCSTCSRWGGVAVGMAVGVGAALHASRSKVVAGAAWWGGPRVTGSPPPPFGGHPALGPRQQQQVAAIAPSFFPRAPCVCRAASLLGSLATLPLCVPAAWCTGPCQPCFVPCHPQRLQPAAPLLPRSSLCAQVAAQPADPRPHKAPPADARRTQQHQRSSSDPSQVWIPSAPAPGSAAAVAVAGVDAGRPSEPASTQGNAGGLYRTPAAAAPGGTPEAAAFSLRRGSSDRGRYSPGPGPGSEARRASTSAEAETPAASALRLARASSDRARYHPASVGGSFAHATATAAAAAAAGAVSPRPAWGPPTLGPAALALPGQSACGTGDESSDGTGSSPTPDSLPSPGEGEAAPLSHQPARLSSNRVSPSPRQAAAGAGAAAAAAGPPLLSPAVDSAQIGMVIAATRRSGILITSPASMHEQVGYLVRPPINHGHGQASELLLGGGRLVQVMLGRVGSVVVDSLARGNSSTQPGAAAQATGQPAGLPPALPSARPCARVTGLKARRRSPKLLVIKLLDPHIRHSITVLLHVPLGLTFSPRP